METKDYHYIKRLKQELLTRQENNSHYSLRAFSRDIGVNPATVSLILRGKRDLPLNKMEEVIANLNLEDKEKTMFRESRMLSSSEINIREMDRFVLDETYYNIISEWEHFAVLALFDLNDFQVTKKSIQSKLDLSEARTDEVIKNLEQHELIKTDDDTIQNVHQSLRTTEDIQSQALRDSHFETLELATQKLEPTPVEVRDYSSETIAIDTQQMGEYKKIIREFRYKLTQLAASQETNEVYQLAIQFFPLSKTNKEH